MPSEFQYAMARAVATYHWFRPDDSSPYLALVPGVANRYITLRHLRYENSWGGLDIEAGTQTDLASVPRILWWFPGLSPTDTTARMALVHDELYRRGNLPRALADMLFRTGLIADGVPPWRVLVMYYGVRIFGGRAWRAHRANQPEVPA